jgi:uncharacterized membrane protein YkvA (DUF1232 family)
VISLFVAWIVLVGFLVAARPERGRLEEAVRILPDTLRLLRRLAGDRTLPAAVRTWLVLLLAYLAFPVDLIPDFVPVIGYADDVILVCVVLRAIVRRAGPDAIRGHWPGTADGLAVLWKVARLPGNP